MIPYSSGTKDVGTTHNRVDQLLSLDGIGTLAQANMADAQGSYTFKPTQNVVLYRVNMVLVRGSANVKGYNGGTALTTGIIFHTRDKDDQIIHTFSPLPVKTLAQYSLLAGVDAGEIQNGVVPVRWTFERAGRPAVLNGFNGEYFECLIADDLSSWDDHYMQVQGFILNSRYEEPQP